MIRKRYIPLLLLMCSLQGLALPLNREKRLATRAVAALKTRLNDRRTHRVLLIHPPSGTILAALDRSGCFTAQHSPGSLFKLLTAWHLLRRGRTTTSRVVSCKSRFYLFDNHRGTGRLIHEDEDFPGQNDYYKCSLLRGHGPLNLIQALAKSCNIYFYNCHSRINWHMMGIDYRRSGFTAHGGQLLPPGRLTHYILGTVGDRARTTLASAAVFVNTIINNGLVRKLSDSGRGAASRIGGGRRAWKILKRGMRRCITRGTGKKLYFPGMPAIAGKTGTGRMGNSIFRVNGWFISYAPCRNPSLLIAAFSSDSAGGGAPLKNSRFLYKKLINTGYFRRRF